MPIRGHSDIYSHNPLSDFSLAHCTNFKTQAQSHPLKHI